MSSIAGCTSSTSTATVSSGMSAPSNADALPERDEVGRGIEARAIAGGGEDGGGHRGRRAFSLGTRNVEGTQREVRIAGRAEQAAHAVEVPHAGRGRAGGGPLVVD